MESPNAILLLEERLYAYDLLRKTFLEEPVKDFCQLLLDYDVIRSFPFSNESQRIKKGVDQVQRYLESNQLSEEETYQDLHWDYTRLFIGPRSLPSPPWESAYLNKERLLFQKETLEVRKFYLKYDFLPKYFGTEADDHVGLELDFMYRLCQESILTYQSNDTNHYFITIQDQMAFLERHLASWIPRFSQDVYHHAETDFYKGMTSILKGFIELDGLALKELNGTLVKSYC
nr:molecular chaperone TorD family protein [uncultured Bacillus sp.]